MANQSSLLAGKRILIAEDEPLIAVDHRSVLSDAGAEIVGTCSTVAQALLCLDRASVDVAVVDNLLAFKQPLDKDIFHPFVVVSSYPRALVRTDEKTTECPAKTSDAKGLTRLPG